MLYLTTAHECMFIPDFRSPGGDVLGGNIGELSSDDDSDNEQVVLDPNHVRHCFPTNLV